MNDELLKKAQVLRQTISNLKWRQSQLQLTKENIKKGRVTDGTISISCVSLLERPENQEMFDVIVTMLECNLSAMLTKAIKEYEEL